MNKKFITRPICSLKTMKTNDKKCYILFLIFFKTSNYISLLSFILMDVAFSDFSIIQLVLLSNPFIGFRILDFLS